MRHHAVFRLIVYGTVIAINRCIEKHMHEFIVKGLI